MTDFMHVSPDLVTTSLYSAHEQRARAPVANQPVFSRAVAIPARTVVGLSGFSRNATAACVHDGRLVAVCDQSRLSRVLHIGIRNSGFPSDAVNAVVGHRAMSQLPACEDGVRYVTAESGIASAVAVPLSVVDHHLAHAATAFFTSGWDEATIIVGDTTAPEVSIWRGREDALDPAGVSWTGPGFASVYSRLTAALGLQHGRDEGEIEALARIGMARPSGEKERWVKYSDGHLEIAPEFEKLITEDADSLEKRANRAARVQQELAHCLVAFLRDLGVGVGSRVCLGGGLFHNSAFNTAVRQSRVCGEVFVPVNPGNGGVAVGCALAAHRPLRPERASPFLGPSFDDDEIKRVLDNCKLQYTFADEPQRIERAADMLNRGRLVGWFEGALEWGMRALGHRSIFASPRSPFVLENLNRYLKHRPLHRTYGVVVPESAVAAWFADAAPSPYMECEFVAQGDALAALRPGPITRLRVQTVDDPASSLAKLLDAVAQGSGVPILVNTSFNGFHEPTVCSPRDAVRVFYGTGLDLLIIGSFIIEK